MGTVTAEMVPTAKRRFRPRVRAAGSWAALVVVLLAQLAVLAPSFEVRLATVLIALWAVRVEALAEGRAALAREMLRRDD